MLLLEENLIMSEVDYLTCIFCNKKCSKKGNLIRHINNVHKIKTEEDYVRRLLCPQEGCEASFLRHSKFIEHLKINHCIEVPTEELNFASEEDFLNWKYQMQKESLTGYTKETSTKTLQDGTKKVFLICHRLHRPNQVLKSLNERQRKSQGSKKVLKSCPSRIEVFYHKDMTVSVKFWKKHCGHTNDHLASNIKMFNCDRCKKTFSHKQTLTKHKANDSCDRRNNRNYICAEAQCTDIMSSHKMYVEHLIFKHNRNITFEEVCFQSLEDFLQWKNKKERETLSRYVKVSTNKKLQNGVKKTFLVCHRSNAYKTKVEQRQRALKSQGSCKIGCSCPSRIEISEFSDLTVLIKFWPIHCGHTNDERHVNFDKPAKRNRVKKIANKLQADESFDSIIELQEDEATSCTNSLLSKKSLAHTAISIAELILNPNTKITDSSAEAIRTNLDSALAVLNSNCSTESGSLVEKQKISFRQKITGQRGSFFPTKRKSPVKSCLKKPTLNDEMNIIQDLPTDNQQILLVHKDDDHSYCSSSVNIT